MESNNLSADPSQISFQNNVGKSFISKQELSLPKKLEFPNIFIKKQESSSDNNRTPSSNEARSSSSGYPKKLSTSTTDNNPGSSSFPSASTSQSTKSPSPQSFTGLFNIQKPSSSSFQKSSKEILSKVTVPEILEVFTDLDLFIAHELNEINCRKQTENETDKKTNVDEIVFKKLKDEYLKDKKKHQTEFEKQVKQQDRAKDEVRFETIDEEDEKESSLDLTIRSRMSRLRNKKIEKLKKEAHKQEDLFSKINRVLERVKRIDDQNLAGIINIERHYLTCSNRFQSALSEIRRLEDPSEELHPRPFHLKGKCVVKEIMLEIKPSYFERNRESHNEFFVVMLKYDDEVYASKAICITDDVRTIKFPYKFSVSDAYMDFEMRLEVYGTTFWRQRNMIRPTMMKKYGFFQFTLADTGDKRKRFEMVEIIRSEKNPLRKKILMKIHQKITPDVHYQGALLVKLGSSWHKTEAMLCGHLLEIKLPETDCEPMLLDLHNFDSDFIIPVVSHISMKSFSFLLRFNHYVDDNDFCLMVAAESDEEYSGWVKSINKVLVLIN